MAKIKSVKTASGKRVQVGSKAYSRALSSGDSPVSGTGKNLTSGDIKNVGSDFNTNYQDEVSTTKAKVTANEAGKLLPFQQANEAAALAETQAPLVPAETTAQGNLNAVNAPQPTPSGAAVNVPGQQGSVASPYQQGLATWQAQGGATPQSAGLGMAAATSMTPVSPQTGAVDMAFEQDPVLASITSAFAEYSSPIKQKDTLLSQYKSLVKSTGLDEINEELLDTQRIINSTEDDIRKEVTAASGFATESQVLAMSAARNKTLIQNVNNLIATRDSIKENINMMMSLSSQDKQMANDRFEKQIDFAFRIGEYQQKMVNASREGYNSIINSLGYQGLYASLANDPYSLSLAERTLGLGSGQLATLASQPDLDRILKEEQIATERAQRSNIYSQINQRNQPSSGKPPTQTQLQVAGYADRLVEANKIVSDLGNQFTGKESYIGQLLPNPLKSESRQSYEQAQRNFINSVLRRESGATITPDEFNNARKQYFPQPGDTNKTVQQKEANRQTVINSFFREAGNVTSQGAVIGPDGNEYVIID